MTTNPQTPVRPIYKLWEGLKKDNLYTKSFPEFEKQFNAPEARRKLYDGLYSDRLYTKSPEEFEKQFFSDLKKKEPAGQDLSSPVPSGGESSLRDKGATIALTPEQQEAFKNLRKPKESNLFSEKQEQLLKERTVGRSIEGFVPNLIEDVSQIPPSFNRGVISAATAIPKTVGIIGKQLDELIGDDRPLESYPTYQAGKWLEDKALEVGITATDPDREGFMNSTIPQAFGQVVGMLLTGGSSSSSVAKGGSVKELTKTLTSAPAITGALQVAVPEYEAAKAAGMDDDEAFGVFMKNIPGGLTEVVPIMNGLSRINKITGGGIVNTFKSLSVNGLEEAVQETVQQYYSNVIADESYDPGRDPMNGVLEGAGAGFFVGFVLPGLIGAMQNAKPSQKAKIREYLNQKLKDIKEQPIQTDEVQGDVGKAFQETVEKTVEKPVMSDITNKTEDIAQDTEQIKSDSKITSEEQAQTDEQMEKEQSEITEEELVDMVDQIEPVREDRQRTTKQPGDNIKWTDLSGKTFYDKLDAHPDHEFYQKMSKEEKDKAFNVAVDSEEYKGARASFDKHVHGGIFNAKTGEIVELGGNVIPIAPLRPGQISNEVGKSISKFGWTSTETPDGIDLHNAKGKKVATITETKRGYVIKDTGGTKLLSGKGQIGKSAEKVAKEYFYAKEQPIQYAEITDPITQEQDVQETVQAETKDDTLSQAEEVEFDWLGTTKKGKIISEEDGKYKIKGTDGTIFRVKKSDVKNGSVPDQTQQQPSKPKTKKRVITQAQQEEPSDSGVSKEVGEGVGFVQPSGLNFSMPFDISAVTDGAKRWVKKYFTSSGLLPESAFGIANKAEQNKTAALKKAKFLVSDLERAVKKDFKTPDYPLINQVLKGEKPYTDLPPATAKAVEALRNHVTQVQDELIDSGAVQGDLAIAIDESKGTYLTRSYKVHDDPEGYTKWLEENPEGQRIKNRAIGFIRSKFPKATREEIDGIINELLYKPDAPVAILKGGKLGSKDLGVLTKRKDIAPEIRALLGEYDNPIVNYSKSVLKMSNLIANHKLQSEIRKDGMGKYFFEKPTGKYFVKIAPSGSTTMDALTEGKDLYTSKDVAEAINEWNQKDLTPEMLSWLYKINGLASYSKTVLSSSTHARNLIGSGIIAVANGHVFDGAGKFLPSVKSTVTSLANGTDAQVRAKLLDYAKLGIIGDSHQAGYLKDLIKDINKTSTDPSMLFNNRYRKFVNKSLESINAAYQAEDDLFKIFAFENEVDRYSKAYADELKSGKMTENDIRLKAAEIVRATFPTYSLSPKGIKALRRLPFISSFPTFPAEMIRTTWNNVAQTKKELADPKTRSIGLKRMAGMMTVMGMTYGMTEFLRQAYGIFDDEDEALDQFVAPWAKNGQRVHLRGKKNGTYRYIDLSYSDPYSMFKRPMETLFSEGDILENAKETARMTMEPFISEGMLTKRMREIASNTDENRRTIYNPEAPIGDQVNDIYRHLASSVEPGTVRSLKKIARASQGEAVSDYGKEFSIADELIFMGLGQRIETLDPSQALYFKTRELGKRLTDAKDIFDNVKYKFSRGKASKEELDKAFETSQEVSKKIKEELSEVVKAANRLGVDKRIIIDNLNKNVGKKDTF